MPSKNTRFALNLFALVAGMLMLAYASVPLYRIFCQATGYGGTTREAKYTPGKIVDRQIAVTFNADVDPHLNWEFKPAQKSVEVRVGKPTLVYFIARNLEPKPVTGRAVYNVVPFGAGSYFVKTACFCFKEQTLAAGQTVRMPVTFYIDPDIMNDRDMDNVKTITLSYTFFPVKK